VDDVNAVARMSKLVDKLTVSQLLGVAVTLGWANEGLTYWAGTLTLSLQCFLGFPLSEWSSSCTQPFKLQLESQLMSFVLLLCIATDVQVEEVDL